MKSDRLLAMVEAATWGAIISLTVFIVAKLWSTLHFVVDLERRCWRVAG
jgi:hypothetical protein